MPRIVVTEPDGRESTLLAVSGRSIMQAARDRMAPYLMGECGGSCICASCHAYVDAKWLGRLAPPSHNEVNMLDAIETVRHNSRLTCRIIVDDSLDGISIRIPAA